MGIGNRDYAPNLSPVERPEMDADVCDPLCASCGNTSCPLDDKRATQCVEYYPLNPTEDACPTPTTTTT
jgi:hypothetical protein